MNHRHVFHSSLGIRPKLSAQAGQVRSPAWIDWADQEAIGSQSRSSSMQDRVFENAPRGLVIIAPDGRPLATNAAMRTIVEARDGLRFSERGIVCSDAAADRQLRDTINTYLQTPPVSPDEITWLPIGRPSGRRSYTAAISMLPPAESPGMRLRELCVGAPASQRGVLLRVIDAEQAIAVEADVLRSLYSLTRAEACLAAMLLRKGRLAEAAASCGLTKGSARQYLHRIFEKTGTASQVDLIVRLARAAQI